jgi:aryl-alcohol dehydrogenase-like predicted oxidoreductase
LAKNAAANLVTASAALLGFGNIQQAGSSTMRITRRRAIEGCAALGAAAALGNGAWAQNGQLIQKRIPKTGEQLPPIGIGTNRYGVGTSEEERAPLRDTMARFVELGGKVMDTAMIYGTSEAVIGELAQGLSIRDRLFYSTKTDIRGQLRGEAGLQQALTRMKTDMIDAMLVHNLVNADTELPVLREWQRQGKFRYIGASISTPDQFDQMEQFMRNNDVEIVQFNYSLGDRLAAERLLPTAADRGIAVMINVPFGGGRDSIFDVVESRELPDFAAEFDATTWGQFFLKYIVSHPAVTVAIPGTRRVEHVNDNFGAAFGRLPDAALRRRQEQFFDSIS